MPSASVSTATSGANIVIAAPAITTAWIRVFEYALNAAGAVTVKFGDGTNDITGAMTLGTSINIYEFSQDGLFDVPVNTALILTLGGNIQVSGHIKYALMGDLQGNPDTGYAGLTFDFSNPRNLILS